MYTQTMQTRGQQIIWIWHHFTIVSNFNGIYPIFKHIEDLHTTHQYQIANAFIESINEKANS